MEFQKVFTIKKEVTKEQFLRNVLIGLSKDDKSPANIMKAEFGEVVEFNTEFLLLSGNIEVNYSGSCGYDRQEQYQTTESRYVSEGDYYTCNGVQRRAVRSGSVQVDVIKTRTVTDWMPHSGTINAEETSYGINDSAVDEGLEGLFVGAIQSANNESIVEEGNASVNTSAYKKALETCERFASYRVSWPGDHHKDTRYNYNTDVTSLECYIVPCYSVEFQYNGKKYRARGLAFGQVNEVHEVPPTADGSVESVEIIEKRRQAKVEEAEKPLKINTLFTVLAVIMGIVGFYGLVNIGIPDCGAEVCLPLGFGSMVIFIVIQVIISNKVKKVVQGINDLSDKEKRDLNNIKADYLVLALERMNLPALSKSEKNGISSNDDYEDDFEDVE